jgi:hypothetical protein
LLFRGPLSKGSSATAAAEDAKRAACGDREIHDTVNLTMLMFADMLSDRGNDCEAVSNGSAEPMAAACPTGLKINVSVEERHGARRRYGVRRERHQPA